MRKERWREKKSLVTKNIADIILLDAYILELHKQSFTVVCVTLKNSEEGNDGLISATTVEKQLLLPIYGKGSFQTMRKTTILIFV